MTSRTVSGVARPAPAPPSRAIASSVLGRVAQVGLQHDPGRRARRGTPPRPAARARARRRPRASRTTPCRCAGARRARSARRSRPRSRSAASRLPRSGASGRSSGVSAETFTERFARGSGPAESRSSAGARARPRRARRACRAPRRSARRSARPRPAVTVASPSRSTEAATPSFHSRAGRRSASFGRLADDEAVRHVLDAGGGGGARARRAPPRESPIRIATPSGGGGSSTSSQEAREVARRGRRGSGRRARRRRSGTARPCSSASARGEVHRLVVERLERAPRRRRQALPQAPADVVQLAFQLPLVDHGADDIVDS